MIFFLRRVRRGRAHWKVDKEKYLASYPSYHSNEYIKRNMRHISTIIKTEKERERDREMTLIPHELAMKAIAVDNDKRSAKRRREKKE